MDNKLAPIYQASNETEFDFIQRAIEQMKNDHEKYSLVFLNNITIPTYDYDMFDPLTANIINAEYNARKIEKERVVELDPTIIETIDLIAKKAEENLHSQNQGRIAELEEKLATLEKNRGDLISNIYTKFARDAKDLNDKFSRMFKNEKRKISRLNIEKQPKNELLEIYSKDLSEQQERLKIEKALLDAKIAEEKNIVNHPEMLTSETYQKEAARLKAEREKLEWAIESYQEYIEYISGEVTRLEIEINNIDEQISNIKNENLRRVNLERSAFESRYGMMQGDKKPNVNEIVTVKDINKEIEKVKGELSFYTEEPAKLKDEIITSMRNGEARENLAKKLSNLALLVGEPTIKGVLDKKEYANIQETITATQEKLKEVEERYNKNDYVDQAKKAEDDKIKARIIERQKEYQAKIEGLQENKRVATEKKRLNSVKEELNRVEHLLEVNEERRQNLAKCNPEKAKAYEAAIKDLKQDQKDLQQKVENIQSLPIVKPIMLINGEIQRLENKINEDKAFAELLEKNDYTNHEAKNQDKEMIETLNKNLEALEKTSKKLEENNIEQLISRILDSYENKKYQEPLKTELGSIEDEDIEENIFSEIDDKDIEENIKENELEEVTDINKSPSKTLIEKIKSNKFVQKISGFFDSKRKINTEPVTTTYNSMERHLYAISKNGNFKEITESEISKYIDDGYDVRLVSDISEIIDNMEHKRNKSM